MKKPLLLQQLTGKSKKKRKLQRKRNENNLLNKGNRENSLVPLLHRKAGDLMKLDVNSIENNIYTKVCSDFADYSEKKLHRYRTVFEFLRAIGVAKIITPTTLEVYETYKQFCNDNGLEPLVHTIFSKTLCECGFKTRHTQEWKTKKKLVYFVLI